MTDLYTFDPVPDDVAAMIDGAVPDPQRAEHIKDQLRRRVGTKTPAASSASDDQPEGESGADLDDFWDNVPI